MTGEGTHEWRITSLENRIQRIEDHELHATISYMRERIEALHEDLIWLKRALFGAILTLLGGMVLFLASIAAGWLG